MGGASPSKERSHLNQEVFERNAAGRSLATGNYSDASYHENRADWAAYQADKVHHQRYMKGRTFAPYAFHPGPQPFPAGAVAGGRMASPTFTATPYCTQMGSGAIYPGYSGPTVFNPMGSMVNTVPITSQVPISSQTYDLCLPTTALAPLPAAPSTMFPQTTGFGNAVYPSAGFY